MNKKLIVIVISGVLILSSSAIVWANRLDTPLPWMHEADKQVEEMIKAKKVKLGAVEESYIDESGYKLYLRKAKTQEQIDALKALEKDTSMGWGVRTRDALEIIGELPKNARRIIVEDAEQIIQRFSDKHSIINALNKIAWAPDFEGGSGMTITAYFADDNHKDAFFINFNGISHVIYDDNGHQTKLPLKGEIILPDPGPSIIPSTETSK
jgi:hypothetical protein